MKITFLILSLIYSIGAFGACSSPISRTNNSPNAVLTSTKYNADLNTVYTKVNELDGDCITDNTIATAKLEDSSVTRAKLATGAVAKASLVSKTSNYTATSSEDVILVDATSGSVTITLPTASGISGKVYTIKKTDSSANTVIVDGNASETIDGSTTVTVWKQYQYLYIVSDGTNWDILAGQKCSSAIDCESYFSAKASSSDTVSEENLDWINGNCTNATTGYQSCTFTSSMFSVAPNCGCIAVNTSTSQAQTCKISSVSTSSVVFLSVTNGGAAIDVAIHFWCSKQGADYTNSKL